MKDKAEKEAHRIAKKYWNLDILSFNRIIKCAIIDVSNTIEALKTANQWTEYSSSAWGDIDNDINFQIEVKKILEDKLD